MVLNKIKIFKDQKLFINYFLKWRVDLEEKMKKEKSKYTIIKVIKIKAKKKKKEKILDQDLVIKNIKEGNNKIK